MAHCITYCHMSESSKRLLDWTVMCKMIDEVVCLLETVRSVYVLKGITNCRIHLATTGHNNQKHVICCDHGSIMLEHGLMSSPQSTDGWAVP